MSESFLRMLAPWLVAGVLDAYVELGSWPRPRWWQIVGQIALLTLAGRSQWRIGRGWVRTPWLAPVVMAFFSMLIYAPSTTQQLVPFLAGLVVILVSIVRLAARWLPPSPLLAAVLTALVVIGSHHIDTVVSGQPHNLPLRTTLDQLSWPLRMLRTESATSDGPPIVVISVDTLRVDAAREMEVVRRLAARGGTWERAMSTANWTLPALASLQTGLAPSEHGAGCFAGGHCQGMSKQVRPLAEDLRRIGYATAAVVANPWVTVGTGFDRGFETFVESGKTATRLLIAGPPAGPHLQDAKYVIDAALEWLARAPARGFYLWVHVVDPHFPYRHAADPELQTLTSQRLRVALPATEEKIREIRAAYAGEVAYADGQIVRLLDALERRGVLDTGVVVFTSDHGEELWEHGSIEHGHTHHGEVVDVPLVVLAPGIVPGPKEGVASLLDVASTIRAAAGLPADGIDLRSGVPRDRIATAWGGVVMHIDCSARDEHTRVIVRDCSPRPENVHVFDLQNDPDELRPGPETPEDRVANAAHNIVPPRVGDAAVVNREALRALGYLQ